MTSRTQVSLSTLAKYLDEQQVTESHPLQPGDEPELVIVDAARPADIVDGFHRVAGYVLWAREQRLSLDSVQVTVIACDDDDLIAAAAEPGGQQAAALAAIYASVN